MENEPARIITAIVTAVEAVLLALIAFGLDVSTDQLAAITTALLGLGGAVSATLIRNRVFAPSTVEEIAANVAAGRDAGLLGE